MNAFCFDRRLRKRARIAIVLLLSLVLHGMAFISLGEKGLAAENTLGQYSDLSQVQQVSLITLEHSEISLQDLSTEHSGTKPGLVSLDPLATRPAPLSISETDALLPLSKATFPYYFQITELSVKPRVAEDHTTSLALVVPGIEPQPVVLRLLISEYGDVDEVVIEESHFPDELVHRIVEAFTKVKFHPGKIDENAVKSQIKIEVTLQGVIPSEVPKIIEAQY